MKFPLDLNYDKKNSSWFRLQDSVCWNCHPVCTGLVHMCVFSCQTVCTFSWINVCAYIWWFYPGQTEPKCGTDHLLPQNISQGRLFLSSVLVAVELPMRYKTWWELAGIASYVIGWLKYESGNPQLYRIPSKLQCTVGLHDWWEFPMFSKGFW